MQTDESLAAYYARRAPEFEATYSLPERQEDLARLRRILGDLVAGADLLEVACGTGYWTHAMAATANSIVATDINEQMLELATAKDYGGRPVRFERTDAWDLAAVPGRFTGGAALFWLSHVAKARIRPFLEGLNRVLEPGARVVLADNLYVPGNSTFLSSTDAAGNTYQQRVLRTGERFEVMKNYPSETELRAAVAGLGTAAHYSALTYYWVLAYRTIGEGPRAPN